MLPTIERTANYPYRNSPTILLHLANMKQFLQCPPTQGPVEHLDCQPGISSNGYPNDPGSLSHVTTISLEEMPHRGQMKWPASKGKTMYEAMENEPEAGRGHEKVVEKGWVDLTDM